MDNPQHSLDDALVERVARFLREDGAPHAPRIAFGHEWLARHIVTITRAALEAAGVAELREATGCGNCAGEQWVCENHMDKPWPSACECGAGAPCPICRPDMANAGLLNEINKWRELAISLHSQFDHRGCTCTFPSEDCCAFTRMAAALTNQGKAQG